MYPVIHPTYHTDHFYIPYIYTSTCTRKPEGNWQRRCLLQFARKQTHHISTYLYVTKKSELNWKLKTDTNTLFINAKLSEKCHSHTCNGFRSAACGCYCLHYNNLRIMPFTKDNFIDRATSKEWNGGRAYLPELLYFPARAAISTCYTRSFLASLFHHSTVAIYWTRLPTRRDAGVTISVDIVIRCLWLD